MLAVGVGGDCLDNFSVLYRFCSLHLSPADGSIKTEIMPQMVVKSKTTIQHSFVGVSVHLVVRMN